MGRPSEFNFTAPFKASYDSTGMGFGLGGRAFDAGLGGRRLDGMEWQAFGAAYISQRGYSTEDMDNRRNILFHLEGVHCVSITAKWTAFQPQRLKINWIHC